MHQSEFDAVFERPNTRVSAAPLWLAARPSQTGVPRLGLIVAKKVLRRAVDRNRAKRAIRESFRLRKGLPPLDVVVRVVEAQKVTVADADRLFAALQARLRSRAGRRRAP